MIYRLLAEGILVLHLGYVLFVVFGGLFALRWRRVIYFHIPAVIWAFLVQWFQWICPLTPLEIRFRELGGDAGYEGGFIEHYLHQLLYIDAGQWFHITLALFVVLLNVFVYYYVWTTKNLSI